MKKTTFIEKVFTTKAGVASVAGAVALGGILTYTSLSTGVVDEVEETASTIVSETTEDNGDFEGFATIDSDNEDETEIFITDEEEVDVEEEESEETDTAEYDLIVPVQPSFAEAAKRQSTYTPIVERIELIASNTTGNKKVAGETTTNPTKKASTGVKDNDTKKPSSNKGTNNKGGSKTGDNKTGGNKGTDNKNTGNKGNDNKGNDTGNNDENINEEENNTPDPVENDNNGNEGNEDPNQGNDEGSNDNEEPIGGDNGEGSDEGSNDNEDPIGGDNEGDEGNEDNEDPNQGNDEGNEDNEDPIGGDNEGNEDNEGDEGDGSDEGDEQTEPETDGSLLGKFSPDKEVPNNALDKTLTAVHGDMNYWNWTVADENHVNNLVSDLTEANKATLFSEMYALQAEYDSVANDYISVNGFKFYTTAVTGKLDALTRAIQARSLALYDSDNYAYPVLGKDGIIKFDGSTNLVANDDNNGEFDADKQVYNILSDYPYETDFTNNLVVYNAPYGFDGALGFAKAEFNHIVIAGLNPETTNTFYHELGHIYENYLNVTEEDYLNARPNVVLDETYEGSFSENFAEDFRHIMYPYSDEDKRDSFTNNPAPTAEEIEALKEYFTNLEGTGGKQGSYVTINGNIATSETLIAQSDEVTFDGVNVTGDVVITTPSGDTVTVPVNGGTFTLTEDGIYIFNTPFGQFRMIYDADKDWNVVEEDEETLYEEINLSSLTGEAHDWATGNTLMKGVYGLDSEGLLMITSGGEGTFSIEDMRVEDGKLIVTLGSGELNNFIFKVPAEYKGLPVVIENNTLGIPDSASGGDIIFGMDYASQEVPKSLGIALGGIAKTSTGELYYEMIDANGDVVHSNTLNLSSSGQYSRFMDIVNPENFEVGNMTVKFYEDSTKAKEIHSFDMIIVEDEEEEEVIEEETGSEGTEDPQEGEGEGTEEPQEPQEGGDEGTEDPKEGTNPEEEENPADEGAGEEEPVEEGTEDEGNEESTGDGEEEPVQG